MSHKGFLPGPYDHRTALDEVVQMMGGLAYMTGRPGDPLRAGTSVNDIMGGMFGAIGVDGGAGRSASKTGKGQEVQSALFENNVFLVAQHMMQFAVTGQPAAPMPGRISAWADLRRVHREGRRADFPGGRQRHANGRCFCEAFGFADLLADPRLKTNNDRVRGARLDDADPALAPGRLQRGRTERDLRAPTRLPFAPITRPEDLFDDPHLLQTGGLAPLDAARRPRPRAVPLLPLTLGGRASRACGCDPPEAGRAQRGAAGGAGLRRRSRDRGHARPSKIALTRHQSAAKPSGIRHLRCA